MAALLGLSGCRSLFGISEAFTLLAGGSIRATIPVAIDGQIGALGTIQNVTAASVANQNDTQNALEDIQGTQSKLRALYPQQNITPAALLSGPVQPGFYHISGSLVIPGDATITLASDGLYVFNIDGSLVVGDDATIVLLGGPTPDNVIWNAGAAASIGANVDFGGIVVAEGNVNLGANSTLLGRLISRTGDIDLASGEILDPFTFGSFPAALFLPATTYNVIPGETVTFPVGAGFPFPVGFGGVGLFVKNLPPGATHLTGDTTVDTTGTNGSDFLQGEDLTDVEPPIFGTTFSWTPTIPGTYKFTYFVRSETFFEGDGVPVIAAPTAADLTGAIDACTVTINVAFPTSNVGVVTGSGMWGGGRTFQVTAMSRGGRRPQVVGTLHSLMAPGLVLRSRNIHTLVKTDLGGGRRMVTLYGNAAAGRFGVVPFRADFLDGGRSTPDNVMITLTVNPTLNGGSPYVTFSGNVLVGSLHIR